MKPLPFILVVLVVLGCGGGMRSDTSTAQDITDPTATPEHPNTMTDLRDGETYATVTIGKQTWMAENLRYNALGSLVNPANPSPVYGRLYPPDAAQTACPDGWHLPSDAEWSELETFLGMSATDTATTFWRGTHGADMKSANDWGTDLADSSNGTNSSGFNAFPAGYYAPGDGFGGLRRSTGFWASAKDSMAWSRWLGAPLAGVNRQSDHLSSEFANACRCVKD